ncbi:hypothetical protein BDK51DRAFT_34092, partial [Blyttiomyces helicus]
MAKGKFRFALDQVPPASPSFSPYPSPLPPLPHAPVGASAVTIPSANTTLYFAGRSSSNLTNALFTLHPTTLRPTPFLLSSTQNASHVPPPRYRHCCAVDSAAPLPTIMYCVGGLVQRDPLTVGLPQTNTTTLWRLNADSALWLPPVKIPGLQPRAGHQCAADAGRLFVFGGQEFDKNDPDVGFVDVTKFTWISLANKTQAIDPSPSRYGSSLVPVALDPNSPSSRQFVFLFGWSNGASQPPANNSMPVFNPTTLTWSTEIFRGTIPPFSDSSACAALDSVIYCVGGDELTDWVGSYTWSFNTSDSDPIWKGVLGTPLARTGSTLVVDRNGTHLVLWGGGRDQVGGGMQVDPTTFSPDDNLAAAVALGDDRVFVLDPANGAGWVDGTVFSPPPAVTIPLPLPPMATTAVRASGGGGSGLSAGVIAGIVLGGLFVALALCALVVLSIRRRRISRQNSMENPNAASIGAKKVDDAERGASPEGGFLSRARTVKSSNGSSQHTSPSSSSNPSALSALRRVFSSRRTTPGYSDVDPDAITPVRFKTPFDQTHISSSSDDRDCTPRTSPGSDPLTTSNLLTPAFAAAPHRRSVLSIPTPFSTFTSASASTSKSNIDTRTEQTQLVLSDSIETSLPFPPLSLFPAFEPNLIPEKTAVLAAMALAPPPPATDSASSDESGSGSGGSVGISRMMSLSELSIATSSGSKKRTRSGK